MSDRITYRDIKICKEGFAGQPIMRIEDGQTLVPNRVLLQACNHDEWQEKRITELEASESELLRQLQSIRAGHTKTVEFDLSPAMKESALREKLVDMGWGTPEQLKQAQTALSRRGKSVFPEFVALRKQLEHAQKKVGAYKKFADWVCRGDAGNQLLLATALHEAGIGSDDD